MSEIPVLDIPAITARSAEAKRMRATRFTHLGHVDYADRSAADVPVLLAYIEQVLDLPLMSQSYFQEDESEYAYGYNEALAEVRAVLGAS